MYVVCFYLFVSIFVSSELLLCKYCSLLKLSFVFFFVFFLISGQQQQTFRSNFLKRCSGDRYEYSVLLNQDLLVASTRRRSGKLSWTNLVTALSH